MRKKRRNHSAAWRSCGAIALAEQFDVHLNQIQDWKMRLVEGAGELFARSAPSGNKAEETVQALQRSAS